VFAGIDSHKDTLAVALVDQVGLAVAVVQESNTRAGFVRIGELLAKHQVTRVGIEGSGHYGRCIAAYLALDWDQPGVGVFEVPTLMTSRERGARPGKGKTDPVDAVAIARITMREPDLPRVRLAVGQAADLRALLDYREDLVMERSELVNRAHADLHGLFPGYQDQITNLITKAHLDAAQQLLADDQRVRAELTRCRLARVVEIDRETAELKQRIGGYVAASGSTLTSIYGVGPIIAARFLAEVVDINRYQAGRRQPRDERHLRRKCLPPGALLDRHRHLRESCPAFRERDRHLPHRDRHPAHRRVRHRAHLPAHAQDRGHGRRLRDRARPFTSSA